jgi:hypothetical protein
MRNRSFELSTHPWENEFSLSWGDGCIHRGRCMVRSPERRRRRRRRLWPDLQFICNFIYVFGFKANFLIIFLFFFFCSFCVSLVRPLSLPTVHCVHHSITMLWVNKSQFNDFIWALASYSCCTWLESIRDGSNSKEADVPCRMVICRHLPERTRINLSHYKLCLGLDSGVVSPE